LEYQAHSVVLYCRFQNLPKITRGITRIAKTIMHRPI